MITCYKQFHHAATSQINLKQQLTKVAEMSSGGSSMAILSFCGDVVVIAALNASLMGQSCEFILKSVSSLKRVGSVGNDNNSNWNDLTILKTGERREGVYGCERAKGVATPAKIPLSKKL